MKFLAPGRALGRQWCNDTHLLMMAQVLGQCLSRRWDHLMALDWHRIDFLKNISLRFMNKICMNFRKEICSYKQMYSLRGKWGDVPGIERRGVFCKNKDLGKYVKLIASSQKNCAKSSSLKKSILWINQKWSNILAEYQFFRMSPTVPLVDISIEMSDSELYSAIGIACFIAYKSGIHRVLLMSHIPIWIVMDNSMDFISSVLKILSECKDRTMCNYLSSISMVHRSQILSNFDVSILILSNFHFLKRKFRMNPIYKNVRLLFWNIGSSYQNLLPFYDPDILMISGTSLSVVRFMDSLYYSKCDSYDFLCKIMDDRRFHKLSTYFNIFLDSYSK
jgi:hypothetical protein